jgi:lipid A 3-O-deacylase
MRSSAVWISGILLAVSAAAPLAGAPFSWSLGPPESVVASSGVFDPLVGGGSYEVGAEFRFAPRRLPLLPEFLPEVAPTAGVIAGSQGALYVYGGVRSEIPLGERWTVSPSWAAGLYHRSVTFDLGGPLEFRTGIELDYRLASGARLGVCLYHLSNGGLFERNPGSESLVLTYSAGLRRGR